MSVGGRVSMFTCIYLYIYVHKKHGWLHFGKWATSANKAPMCLRVYIYICIWYPPPKKKKHTTYTMLFGAEVVVAVICLPFCWALGGSRQKRGICPKTIPKLWIQAKRNVTRFGSTSLLFLSEAWSEKNTNTKQQRRGSGPQTV